MAEGCGCHEYFQASRSCSVQTKQIPERDFGAVPELPMGQQMQVDFGEMKVPTTAGSFEKLYFVGFVLSHSRFKYVEWLDRPFRTTDLIHMQENAFRYFGGMTQEIVYDQDHLLAVSENAGDIMMTAEFTKYQQARKFKVYLCRKADPQSKGKIEQVIKSALCLTLFLYQNLNKFYILNRVSSINLSRSGISFPSQCRVNKVVPIPFLPVCFFQVHLKSSQ